MDLAIEQDGHAVRRFTLAEYDRSYGGKYLGAVFREPLEFCIAEALKLLYFFERGDDSLKRRVNLDDPLLLWWGTGCYQFIWLFSIYNGLV
jgi:hypothetical protein